MFAIYSQDDLGNRVSYEGAALTLLEPRREILQEFQQDVRRLLLLLFRFASEPGATTTKLRLTQTRRRVESCYLFQAGTDFCFPDPLLDPRSDRSRMIPFMVVAVEPHPEQENAVPSSTTSPSSSISESKTQSPDTDAEH